MDNRAEDTGVGAPAVDAQYANFVVVLNETQNLINIAGALRAMMNMGIRRLRLVRPAEFDAYRIAGIAHGTEQVLERVEFYDSLREAVGDAVHVVGLTARRRTASFVWQHPREAAPELISYATSGDAPVALVFGREDKGLANEDLDLCDRLLTIPTDPRHSSLNLAQAVLLVCYELWLAGPGSGAALPEPRRRAEREANAEEMISLFEQTEQALDMIEFFKKKNPHMIMRTLRAIARRADLDVREAKLLRAIAYELQHYLKRTTTRE